MATAQVLTSTHPGPTQGDLSYIRSNEGELTGQNIDWLRPTTKDTPLPEMRRRLHEDGYLFVKNLLPKEDVVEARKHYFQHYLPTGLTLPSTDLSDGIYNHADDPASHMGIGGGDLPPSDLEVRTMISSHVTPEYLTFLEHPDLRDFVRKIMGWDEEVLLQRTMLRHNVPGGTSTAVHYDKLFLRDGGAWFLTAWVPMGDISLHGGGLIYLSRSHHLGREIEEDFMKRAATFSEEERISAFNVNMMKGGMLSQNAETFHATHVGHDKEKEMKWLASSYEAGDVVFHDPYAIHASGKNEDPEGRIRLSTDLRFYRKGSDLDKRWMKYWVPGDGL